MPWLPDPDVFGNWFTVVLMCVCLIGLVATVVM